MLHVLNIRRGRCTDSLPFWFSRCSSICSLVGPSNYIEIFSLINHSLTCSGDLGHFIFQRFSLACGHFDLPPFLDLWKLSVRYQLYNCTGGGASSSEHGSRPSLSRFLRGKYAVRQ